MKTRSCVIGLLCSFICAMALRAEGADYDDAHRFVFYAVLEGCYEDGLSSNDVAQIVMKRAGEGYFHFIYSCPLCTPALHAFNAYKSQPSFYGMKNPSPTFGHGLEPDLEKQLYSEKTEDRLAAINTLVQRWIKRRITLLRLTEAEQTQLQKALEAKRKKGNDVLNTAAADNEASKKMIAPGYTQKDECAICNAAVGMALRLHD